MADDPYAMMEEEDNRQKMAGMTNAELVDDAVNTHKDTTNRLKGALGVCLGRLFVALV
jgi:hypothetical protein